MHDVLTDISILAAYTSKIVGGSDVWQKIVQRTETVRVSLCKVLKGKTVFDELYGVHSLSQTSKLYLNMLQQRRDKLKPKLLP